MWGWVLNIKMIKQGNVMMNMMKISCGLLLMLASFSAASLELVTTKNFVRAETDMQMKSYIDTFNAFGSLQHNREMYDVTKQLTIRPNTDTLYSFGIFDLSESVDIHMPKTSRYQSAMVVNQDHSLFALYAGKHRLTQEDVGSRYVFIILRTFVDPNHAADLAVAHALQDEVTVQQKSKGSFKVPEWDEVSLSVKRQELAEIAKLLPGTQGMFGNKEKLNPVIHLIGTAFGWGGLPEQDAFYNMGEVIKNNGKTVHTLTVKDVPVDGFWSVTVYNKQGYFDSNERGIYSLNNKTAIKNKDGSVTIQFGNCKSADNCLDIMPDWNYAIRQYQPQQSILDGSWVFPLPQPK